MRKHPHAGTPQFLQTQEPIRVRDIHAPFDDIKSKDYEPVRTPGCVYFIQAEHGGPIKIGWSVEPAQRLAGVQTGHPYKLVIRRVVHTERWREGQLHARFAAHRLEGEWFEPVEAILDIIRTGDFDFQKAIGVVTYSLICVDCFNGFEWEGPAKGKRPPTICLDCADRLERAA